MVLYHHGIKGMHWGIRRFQNKDGSLTAEGIKRYRTDLNFKYKYDKYKAKQDAKAAEKAKQKEIKRVDKLMKKNSRKLTAEELEERINRLAMETRIVDLERGLDASKPSNKNNPGNNQGNNNQGKDKVVGFGKKLAGDIITNTGNVVAKGIAGYVGAKILKGMFGDKDGSESTSNKSDKNQSRNTNDDADDDDNITNSGKTTGAKGVKGMPWGVRDKDKAKTFDGVVDEDYSSDRKHKESTWTKWTNDFVDVDYTDVKSGPFNSSDNNASSYDYGKHVVSGLLSGKNISGYLTTNTASNIVDADYTEVKSSPSTSFGQSIVSGRLSTTPAAGYLTTSGGSQKQTIIDVDYKEIKSSPSTKTGKAAVSGLLTGTPIAGLLGTSEGKPKYLSNSQTLAVRNEWESYKESHPNWTNKEYRDFHNDWANYYLNMDAPHTRPR